MRIPLLSISNARTYATAPLKRPSRPHTRTRTPFLSLDCFIQRQRVLALYRSIVRATNKIPNTSSTRYEMKLFAREEFERNKGVADLTQIRYLVSTGKTQFDKMRGYVE